MKINDIAARPSEHTTTLNQIYGNNFPDNTEVHFWDCVRPNDLDASLQIRTMSANKLRVLLLSQYRVEDPEELLDYIRMDRDRRLELLQQYRTDATHKPIVLCGDRIVDGNHRALASVLERRPISYVDLADLEDASLDEAVLDPSGWGNTPYGTDIDYFGLRVRMRPSVFLQLAKPLLRANVNLAVAKHMRGGGSIAPAMLDIEIPHEWTTGDYTHPAKVADHEGRNRMTQWIKIHGDEPIQVNIRLRGGLRRKHINDGMITALSTGLISQRGNYVDGPLFEPSTALEESLLDETLDAPYRLGDRYKYGNMTVILPDNRELRITFESLGWSAVLFSFSVDDAVHTTGGGDAQRIFATVSAALDRYVGSNYPELIVFGVYREEASRVKMFDRIVKRWVQLPHLRNIYTDITNNRALWPDDLEALVHEQHGDTLKIYVLASSEYLNEIDQ